MVKLVAFDLDGTLMDAYQAVARSVNYAMKERGLPSIDDETIKRTVGWGDRHLLRNFVPEEDVETTLKIYRDHHEESLKSGTKLLPGAKEVLDYCREKKLITAIASNRPAKYTAIALDYLQIRDYFDEVLCGDQLERAKPHPDILIQILEKFELKPEEAIYVGDMTVDVITGNRAGVRTAAVTTGSSSREELIGLNPDWILDRVDEVKGIITDELEIAR